LKAGLEEYRNDLRDEQKILIKDTINYDKGRHFWFYGEPNIGKSTWIKNKGYLGIYESDFHYINPNDVDFTNYTN